MPMFENLPVFSELPAADKNILSLFCQERFLKAGTTLFNEGDEGMAAYILKEGSLGVFKTQDGKKHLFTVITERGSMVGEMALFDQTAKNRRTASVVAQEDSWLIVISDSAMVDFALEHPTLLEHIKNLMEQRKQMNF